MNIEEKIEFLRKRHPAFGKKVLYDVDNRGHEFCEMIYPNEHNPSMPVTVSVDEKGCLISVGQISNVTGDNRISPEQAASAIDDIVNDRIIFVLGYADGIDIGSGAPFMTEIFAITGEEDDMSEALDDFIARISVPAKGFWRKLTRLKGRFIITDFSGKSRREITR